MDTGGIGRYATEVTKRLTAGADVIVPLRATFRIRDPLGPLKLGSAIRRAGGDVFWSPGFVPPLSANLPYVVTLHDLIHVQYGTALQRAYYHTCIRPLARRADCIVTVSEHSRKQIAMWLGIRGERVAVTPPGVASAFSPMVRPAERERPYLLYVGNYRVHKNIERMIEGFARSGISSDCALVIAGPPDPALAAVASRFRVNESFEFTGTVVEERLPSLYRGSLGLVLVSLEEGFGLPVLEAMACGVPVLCSASIASAEISEGAALHVNPRDIDAIAAGMRSLVEDQALRERLGRAGPERAAYFSWEKTANEIRNILSRVVAEAE
ncbi:MAG TPA: glycosyltransferase family 1 protein [Gammaproteobacteria bacterium]|nr:glycosyltransferase family 1 protein [Gammaproteobacteria bacterium]